jgi:hypothetical protein
LEVFVEVATGAWPNENPPVEDGVVGAVTASFWPKEKPGVDVFWPKPLNPTSLFSCFSSGLAAKRLSAGVLGAPPNENGAEPV